MRISISARGDPRGSHVVLSCTKKESLQIHSVVEADVLGPGKKVEKDFDRIRRTVSFRFSRKYLDRLLASFPQAEISVKLQEHLNRKERQRLESLPVPRIKVPGYSGKWWKFQKIDLVDILESWARGEGYLLNHDLGLGKTRIALGALRKARAFPALAVVPNLAKIDPWEKTVKGNFDFDIAVIDAPTKPRREVQIENAIEDRTELIVVNYEMIRARDVEDPDFALYRMWEYDYPILFDYIWEALIVDEHHRIKNAEAQQTKGFFQLEANRHLYLSGTPILSRIEEIWTVLHKLFPEEFPTYADFLHNYTVMVGGEIIAYKNMAHLRERLHRISSRWRREHVTDQVPDVINMIRQVELTKEQRRLYNEIKDKMLLWLDDGRRKTVATVQAKMVRLYQACFSPELYGGSNVSAKINDLKELAAELVRANHKFIVFSQWTKATNIIRRELAQYDPAYVTGEISNVRKRHAEQERFLEDDDCHCYIGSIGANREAISLPEATYVVFTDKDFVPGFNEQAIGRSAAGGLRGLGKEKVTVVDIIAADTVEEDKEMTLDAKRRTFAGFVERDGGRVVERRTLKSLAELIRG